MRPQNKKHVHIVSPALTQRVCHESNPCFREESVEPEKELKICPATQNDETLLMERIRAYLESGSLWFYYMSMLCDEHNMNNNGVLGRVLALRR